jgi:hypothetical protein
MEAGGRRTGSGTDAVGSAVGIGMALGRLGTGSTGVGTGAGEVMRRRPATRRATAIPM